MIGIVAGELIVGSIMLHVLSYSGPNSQRLLTGMTLDNILLSKKTSRISHLADDLVLVSIISLFGIRWPRSALCGLGVSETDLPKPYSVTLLCPPLSQNG